MATKCPNGACYDDAGVCGCGMGHRDPDAEKDDAGRIAGEIVQGTPIVCKCGNLLSVGDHSACFKQTMDSARPN